MSRHFFALLCPALIFSFCSAYPQSIPNSPLAIVEDTPLPRLRPAAVNDAILNAATPSVVTLYGTAEKIGSAKRESGSVVLKISEDGADSEEWSFPSGKYEYAESALSSNRDCLRTNPQQVISSERGVSCQRPLPWFAAWFASTLSKKSLLKSEIVDSVDGTPIPDHVYSAISAVTHERSRHGLSEFKRASSVRVTYDGSGRPLRSTYVLPAGEYGSVVYMTVLYDDYRDENGFMLPHHLVRYVQGTIELDIKLSRIAAN